MRLPGFRSSGIGIALLDLDGRAVSCNPALEALLGYSEGELLERQFSAFTHPEDVGLDVDLFRDVVEERRTQYEIGKRYRHKDGHVVWAQLTVSRVPGDLEHAIAVVHDNSEARRLHAERDRLLQTLSERVREMSAVQEATWLLHDDSLGLEALLQRLVGVILPAFEAPERAAVRVCYEGIEVTTPGYAETPWRIRTPFGERDRRIGWIDAVYLRERPGAPQDPFLAEEHRLLETIARMLDVTLDRRRAEERLQVAVGAGGVALWEWDIATGRLSWPGRGDRPTTRSPWGLAGTLEEGLARIHPEDRERIEALAQATLVDPTGPGRLQTELRLLGPEGTPSWVLVRGQVVLNAEGKPERMLGVATDISERHALELRLGESQKMEAIGVLAGGVAHDFNNLLSVILGFGEMLQTDLGKDHPGTARLEQIVRAGHRAAELTRQLLSFSRRQLLKPTLLDLNAVLHKLETMLPRLIREDIDLVTRLAPTLGTVRADAGQVEQVIVNLVVNARDAMTRGGRLVLSTADVAIPERRYLSGEPLEAGDWVVLSVEDSGAGMDPAVQERLFEPFFTTKGPGRGTGLGLATVRAIVRQCGGHVAFTSALGKGSTFYVYLPRVAEAPTVETLTARDPHLPRGTGTILLVEDQTGVREFATEALKAQGYRVLVASDAEQAEVVALASADQIDLLLTDVVMPGASGAQLAESLAARHPRLRVVLMSGYATDVISSHGAPRHDFTLLEKPLTLENLAWAVHDALSAPPAAASSSGSPPD